MDRVMMPKNSAQDVMEAVALAKGRYRPGIDQEFIKKWRKI